MNDILFCLDRVNRVLETKNRRLGSEVRYDHYSSDDEIERIYPEDERVMRQFMREGISEGVEEARMMADDIGFTDKKAIAAMFRDQLYEIIEYETNLRWGICQGLIAGVQQARKQSGVNKTQVDESFRQILDEVLREKLQC